MTAVPLKYTFADLNVVVQMPIMNMMMHRPCAINSTDFDVPNLAGYSKDFQTVYIARILPHWTFRGQPIPVKRFLMMRIQIERALAMTFVEPPAEGPFEGEPPPNAPARLKQELEFLCTALRMTDPDDQRAKNVAEFGKAAELYAVAMLHGESGVKSYQEWLAGLTPHADALPPDLACVV